MRLFDAFPTKEGAESFAEDIRNEGYKAAVRRIPPNIAHSDFMKWGVFVSHLDNLLPKKEWR